MAVASGSMPAPETKRLMIIPTTVALGAMAACLGPRGPVQAPVELAVAPLASLPDAGIVTTGGRSPAERCTLRLVAGRIDKSSPGCYLDERISDGAGTLSYPCGGDGPAEAVFGQHRYAGRMDGGKLELHLSTELDWEDGCRRGRTRSSAGRCSSVERARGNGSPGATGTGSSMERVAPAPVRPRQRSSSRRRTHQPLQGRRHPTANEMVTKTRERTKTRKRKSEEEEEDGDD